MKKSQNRFMTRSQILRLAPLLLCSTAAAAPVIVNEQNGTNVWTLPTGANLLSGSTANTPDSPAGANHGNGDITSSSWTTLTDGTVGSAGVQLNSVAPGNGTSVIFPLNTAVNVNGYNISQFDSYCAWPDNGRDSQNFTIEYSTVSAPATFLPLATVANTGIASGLATHTRITDSAGNLATNVAALRFNFANQENGYVGYREFILLGTAVPLAGPLTWTGSSGSGGNATWIAGADNNWKFTTGGATAPYSSLSPLTFDSSATNRNITVPAALTAASLSFTNGATTPYTFNGSSLVTVTNDLNGSNAGAVTFANPLSLSTGLTMTGAGSLTFNGALDGNGVTLSGTGSVTLNSANTLTGAVTVSNGGLKVTNNSGLGTASLAVSGGSAGFTTAAPAIASLSGSGGTVVLGNTSPVVNTVLTVGNETSTNFSGVISNNTGAKGGLTKVGEGMLALSGANTYTGVTTVSDGELEFGQKTSLYNGATASWTAANLVVNAPGILGLRLGGAGEFVDADVAALATGGFQTGSSLGFNTASGDATIASVIAGNQGLYKNGENTLTLTGANTYKGDTLIVRGAVNAANPTGPSIPGNVTLGDHSFNMHLNMGANNQFAAGSVLTFANGPGASNAKFQLRGTTQTVEGLESTPDNRLTIMQNDEANTPGFTTINLNPATLVINATTDHSFYGLIRDGDVVANPAPGPLGITKNGPGMQELINASIQNTHFTGPTIINNGKLKLTYNGGAYTSPVTINSPGLFALDGTFTIGQVFTGNGKILKEGGGMVTVTNGTSLNSGGTDVNEGILIYQTATAPPGEGTAAGDHCIAGLMDPTNVVTVNNGAMLQLNGTAPLGNSNMLPQFGVSVVVNENSILYGGVNTVAFVPNLTLNGASVDVSSGGVAGGFNTNLGLVGTVVVGGSSTIPSLISTSGTGANANISLGDNALKGTTFQVADVTGSASDDLTVSSILQNVHGVASGLTKTGPGTMHLTELNTYTGDTTVSAGTLVLDQAYLASASNVSIGSSAFLSLQFSGSATVNSLSIGGTAMAAGTYVATTNNLAGAIKTARITGPGALVVTTGGTASGYDTFAATISDPAQRGRDADPDGDGFTNLQEYLFGTSPTATNGSLLQTQVSGTNLIVRWYQLPSSGTYTLEESTTLTPPWTASTATIGNAATQTNPNYTLKEATIPIVAGTKKFVRVTASE